MILVQYCERCRWRTKHLDGVCVECTPPEPPEPQRVPGGTIDLFGDPLADSDPVTEAAA